MSVMNHLAQAAAMLLLLEVLVVAMIFAAISGGLAFGLHWVNGKTGWVFNQVNGYLALGRKYIHLGTDYAGKPFILLGGWTDRLETTFGSLRRQAQELQARRSAPREVAARPIEPTLTVPPTDPLV
jgi:hypothetical protein